MSSLMEDDGSLNELLQRVHKDSSLCLEIRANYINIYYRGGNLLKVAEKLPDSGKFEFHFDEQYAKGRKLSLPSSNAPVSDWIEKFPTLKHHMDLYLGEHPKEERETQQLIVRENNFGRISRATDYYICDIEYASPGARFDMVAVHWPSTGVGRKRVTDHRLVLVEVKYGEGALAGSSGIDKHLRDIDAFVKDTGKWAKFKDEMKACFNQKQKLRLIKCSRDIKSFSEERPLVLLVLVNHDPESSKLADGLANLSRPSYVDLAVATSCFMGYGLFDEAILSLDEFLKTHKRQIHSK